MPRTKLPAEYKLCYQTQWVKNSHKNAERERERNHSPVVFSLSSEHPLLRKVASITFCTSVYRLAKWKKSKRVWKTSVCVCVCVCVSLQFPPSSLSDFQTHASRSALSVFRPACRSSVYWPCVPRAARLQTVRWGQRVCTVLLHLAHIQSDSYLCHRYRRRAYVCLRGFRQWGRSPGGPDTAR